MQICRSGNKGPIPRCNALNISYKTKIKEPIIKINNRLFKGSINNLRIIYAIIISQFIHV
jgi:hypothetical protein